MKTLQKTGKFFTAAACAALVMGLAASPAHALDEVDWQWNLNAWGKVKTDLDIEVEAEPTGLVQLSETQVNIGDIDATSTVTNIKNKPVAGEEDDEIMTSFFFPWPPAPEEEIVALDAIDLPAVESAATAVANNMSIESSSSLAVNNAQFAFGGFDEPGGYHHHWFGSGDTELGDLLGEETEEQNINTNMLLAIAADAAAGDILPAEISATSEVSDILNASVDSAATAVANNMDISLDAASPDDASAFGDLTQMAYADVNALSTVEDVTVKGYANMKALEGPLVSSAATAVGNNLSFKVSAPEL